MESTTTAVRLVILTTRCLPPSTDTDQPTVAEPTKRRGTLDSSPALHPGQSGSYQHNVIIRRRRLQFSSRSKSARQYDDVIVRANFVAKTTSSSFAAA